MFGIKLKTGLEEVFVVIWEDVLEFLLVLLVLLFGFGFEVKEVIMGIGLANCIILLPFEDKTFIIMLKVLRFMLIL